MFSDHISYQAMRQPHAVAVSLPTRDVTYRRFEASINAVAHHLRPLIEPGSRVAVAVDKLYVHWLVVLALARLGHVSTSMSEQEREGRTALVAPDAVVTQDPSWSPAGIAVHVLSDRWLDQALASPDPGRVPERPRPQDPARIITSSGTTGVRKLMLFSHEAIIRRVESRVGFGRSDSRVIVAMPVATSGGFSVPLRTWLFGGAVCLIKPSAKNLLERQVTGLLASPAALKQILDAWPAGFPRIPNLTITVAGGALPSELGMAVRLRLTPDVVMMYASTEVSAVAVGPASMQDRDSSATGIVLPWVDLQVVDDAGRPLAEREEGRIRIRADAGVDRYLGDPETSARVFRDGWFYPGDLGSLSAGILRVTGRADDLINLGGMKISPEALERSLAECPGVADVAAFSARGAGGVEHPCCAVVPGADFDKERFAKMAAELLTGTVHILRVKQIPRNDMGKVERIRLRQMARQAIDRA